MKIIFSFLLITAFSTVVLFSQPPFNGLGDGSETNPYQIWNNAHLKELHDSILNTLWPNYSTWHNGKHFRLMQDITTPLTHSISPFHFQGNFRGGGHKIIVAMINTTNPPDPFNLSRLFGSLAGGCIIDSLTVEGELIGLSGVAGIVGTNVGTISHCTVNVTIIHSHPQSILSGGIASTNSGIISNCVFNGSITGENIIGGIAGNNDFGGTVINCINNGNIVATNSGSNTNLFGQPTSNNGVGGIVGSVNNGCTDISRNINNGSVEGQGFVGGIVGCVRSVITPVPVSNNINYGFIKGTNAVGGILGNAIDGSTNIFNNFNSGVVIGVSETGCIVGRNNGGTISNNHYDKQMCGE